MAASAPGARSGRSLLADRVWGVRTADGSTMLVVAGARGLALVDPPTTPEAAAVVADLGGDGGALVAVVVTHTHAGAAPPRLGAPVHAHEDAVFAGGTADRTVSSVAVVDLGDRSVELVHPGRGHTAGDLVVRVPDVDLVAVGGLAGGDGVPAYGPESFPLEWPAALDLVLGICGPSTVLVPRTGEVLSRARLEEQRDAVGVVAETIADLASRGVPAGEALAATTWPLPAERLGEAVRRGYDQLPRTARRLPLL
jgi:glyoxylase-like metal-dependent hydrolase (beta-lactamase superfamily II)